jgi:hypothetical protein
VNKRARSEIHNTSTGTQGEQHRARVYAVEVESERGQTI